MTTLGLQENKLTDLSQLSGLSGLQMLILSGNQIDSIAPLSGLTGLTSLSLSSTPISDLRPLIGLDRLTRLRLDDVTVSDLSPLTELPSLTDLYLGYSTLDLSAAMVTISELSGLRSLGLTRTGLSDLGRLSGLTNMRNLSLSSNAISDVSPLSGMTSLGFLDLGYNQVTDISALSRLTKLHDVTLTRNQIEDLSPLAAATSLTYLNASENRVEQLGPAGSLSHLTNAFLDRNRLTSIAALTGAPLAQIYLAGNEISDVSPLSMVTPNAEVDVSDNQIRDLSPLPDTVQLHAGYQHPAALGGAALGVPFDFGVRDVDGSPLCPDGMPPSASCSNGVATYPYPVSHDVTFWSPISDFSAYWTQETVGVGQFTSSLEPRLEGGVYVGGSLYSNGTDWQPLPGSLSYRWFSNGTLIPTDSSSLTLTKAEAGKRIRLCLTAHLPRFADREVCTAESAPVAAKAPDPKLPWIDHAPSPKISGTVRVGAKLTAKPGHWDRGVSFHFRWQRNGKDIKGATKSTYRLAGRDRGKKIRVKLTATKPGFKTEIRYSKTVRPKR